MLPASCVAGGVVVVVVVFDADTSVILSELFEGRVELFDTAGGRVVIVSTVSGVGPLDAAGNDRHKVHSVSNYLNSYYFLSRIDFKL